MTELCASLSLDDEAGPTISISKKQWRLEEHWLSRCLVDKVLSLKLVNGDAFKVTILCAWNSLRIRAAIECIGSNMFVFEFPSEVEKQRLLLEGPWHFNNALVVLEQLEEGGDMGAMKFETQDLWIRVYNAPLICMSKSMAMQIGSELGQVLEVDLGTSGLCLGQYLRIRVKIDVTKPI